MYNEVIVYGPYAFKMYCAINLHQDYIYIMIDAVLRRFEQDPGGMNSADTEILAFERDAVIGSRVNFSISNKDLILCREKFPNSRFELFPIIRTFEKNNFKNSKTRNRILFIGSLTHTPNRNALEFILKEIAPIIENLCPNLIFSIVGKGTEECNVYSNNVVLLGMIDSLEDIYSESLVSLAPMSVAAGLNGKVIESIGFGVISLVSKEVSFNLSKSMKKCTIICDSVDDYVKEIGNAHSQNARVSPRVRLEVAKEIDGTVNAMAFRKYLV